MGADGAGPKKAAQYFGHRYFARNEFLEGGAQIAAKAYVQGLLSGYSQDVPCRRSSGWLYGRICWRARNPCQVGTITEASWRIRAVDPPEVGRLLYFLRGGVPQVSPLRGIDSREFNFHGKLRVISAAALRNAAAGRDSSSSLKRGEGIATLRLCVSSNATLMPITPTVCSSLESA